MDISTYKVFLMKRGTGSGAATWAKFLDIKDFPDLGGAPELLDTTTLSDRVKTGILGIQDNALMAFTCNYDKDDYAKVKAEKGKDNEWAVWFGGTEQTDGTVTPTGVYGKFTFKGQCDVYANGGGVNEVVNMTVNIAASTPITEDTDEA